MKKVLIACVVALATAPVLASPEINQITSGYSGGGWGPDALKDIADPINLQGIGIKYTHINAGDDWGMGIGIDWSVSDYVSNNFADAWSRNLSLDIAPTYRVTNKFLIKPTFGVTNMAVVTKDTKGNRDREGDLALHWGLGASYTPFDSNDFTLEGSYKVSSHEISGVDTSTGTFYLGFGARF